MTWPKLYAGDIILSRVDNLSSKLIRFFGKLQTGSADYSHIAFVLDPVNCIEALDRVRINPIAKYVNQTVEVWRVPLSDRERQQFHDGLIVKAANNYAWGYIPLFALDSAVSAVTRAFGRKRPVVWFTKKAGLFNIQVCSQLGVYGYHKFTDYRLLDSDHKEVSWREVSPDYFADLLNFPHNRATLIHKQKQI